MTRPLEDKHHHLGNIVGRHHAGQRIGCPAAIVVEREIGGHAARAHVG